MKQSFSYAAFKFSISIIVILLKKKKLVAQKSKFKYLRDAL